MNVVVLTFPGHFFQTALSIKSINRWYRPQTWAIIIDDLSSVVWDSYEQDFVSYLKTEFPWLKFSLHRTSDYPQLHRCVSGWWRQQLVKLTLDTIVDNDEWFVVDGDVVFDAVCDVKNVIPISFRTQGPNSPLAVLGMNYVRNLLGITQGSLTVNNEYVLTNPIPFRWLTAHLLQQLRLHVEQRYNNKNFVELHLDWFDDQTILAFEDPPQRMIMTEWELIECYKQYVLDMKLPLVEMGSGYPLYMHTSELMGQPGLFRHGYIRDASIDRKWLECQNISVSDDIWQRCSDWKTSQEPWRE